MDDIIENIDVKDFGVTNNLIEQSYKKIILSADNLQFEVIKNIQNEKGILILKAGGKVDANSFDKIVNHKLLKPIDECLKLKNKITPDKLLDDFTIVCNKFIGDKANDFDGIVTVISNIISETNFDDITLNKLTVYKSGCSDNFNHALSTAFLSTKIGVQLNYSHKNLVDIFNACLFHDIGEMFLDFDVHSMESDLTEILYKKVKVHPIIAYSLLKGSKTNFSEEMLRGVLDHHERLNGSGYPRSLNGEHINQYARIVGIVDSFDAMLRKGRTIEDALWTIKLHSNDESTEISSNHTPLDKNIFSILYSFKSSLLESQRTKQIKTPISNIHIIKLIRQLNQINSEVSLLKNHIQKYLSTNQNDDDQITNTINTVNNNLFIIENRIFDTSGLTKMTEQEISNNVENINAIQTDINRIAPELKEFVSKVNRSIKHVQNIDQSEGLNQIFTVNQSLYKETLSIYDSLTI